MSPSNDSKNAVKKIKSCPNRCGKWITWNQPLYAYLEPDTEEKYKCSDWRPKQYHPQSVLRQSKTNHAEIITLKKRMLKLEQIKKQAY